MMIRPSYTAKQLLAELEYIVEEFGDVEIKLQIDGQTYEIHGMSFPPFVMFYDSKIEEAARELAKSQQGSLFEEV